MRTTLMISTLVLGKFDASVTAGPRISANTDGKVHSCLNAQLVPSLAYNAYKGGATIENKTLRSGKRRVLRAQMGVRTQSAIL